MTSKQSKILHLGCGTSNVDSALLAEGYNDVVNIDFSEALINLKRESGVRSVYKLQDARTLVGIADASFDCVLDKGTLDSTLCGSNGLLNAKAMLTEAHRVLKPGGVFLCFSYGQPSTRFCLFECSQFSWKVTSRTVHRSLQVAEVALSKPFYCYICRK